MKVAVIHSGGPYAQRVIDALAAEQPGTVTGCQVPTPLPLIIDEPEEYLPADLGQAEIIIALHLHSDLLADIPRLVWGRATRALIVPIEDPSWVRPGLARQVSAACAQAHIESAFPKPFCAIEPVTPAITEFCDRYRSGKPDFHITLRAGKIVSVQVVRGSPCGLSGFVAEKLLGVELAQDPVKRAMILHHSYPCMATMNLDEESGDTLMHHSVAIQKEAVRAALEKGEV